MKQEVWKWIRTSAGLTAHLKKSTSTSSADSDCDAVASVYHCSKNITIWGKLCDIDYGEVLIGGVSLSERDWSSDATNDNALKLIASREIQRQLRAAGVECIIRDGKTGAIL